VRCAHDIEGGEAGACTVCSPRPAAPGPERPVRYGPWFTARFDGVCSGPCGGDITAGTDRIRSDGDGGWLCEDCGADQT
jgi:hypothetical protein